MYKNATREFILGVLINDKIIMLSNHILITNNCMFEENPIENYQVELANELHFSIGYLSFEVVFVECDNNRLYWQRDLYNYGSMSIDNIEMCPYTKFKSKTADVCNMLCELAKMKINSLIEQNPYNKDSIK